MDAHVAPVITLEPVGVPCGIERSETTVMYRIGTGRSAIHRAAMLIAATALLSLPATDTLAQDTQRVFFPSSAENTKYTQQHLIEAAMSAVITCGFSKFSARSPRIRPSSAAWR